MTEANMTDYVDNSFYIDTADLEYIKRLSDTFTNMGLGDKILGVTTNPNALNKVNATTKSTFETHIGKLARLLDDVDGLIELHTQIPNSLMNMDQILDYIRYVEEIVHDNSEHVQVVFKIPPYPSQLAKIHRTFQNTGIAFNVTGVADVGTALHALSYTEVSFVSLIPGRMNEVGIDYKEHCLWTTRARRQYYQRIIAGSMRTIDQVWDAFNLGMVPTIGTKVWDLFYENPDQFEGFGNEASFLHMEPEGLFAPKIDDSNTQLSTDFFNQMDELGRPIYDELFG